jgi:hypothetical protein
LAGLQEPADSGDRPRARLTAVAKVENEARIAHGLAAEAGWRNVRQAQELLNFSQ